MPNTIAWNDAYSIDGGVIDAQHKQLLELACRILDIDDASQQMDEIKDIAMQLYQPMKYHFQVEEQLAKSSDYPKLDMLVKAHQKITKKMNDTMKSCTNYHDLSVELRKIIFNWIINHMIIMDKDLGRHLEEKTALKLGKIK
jgi:hemerythrin